MSDGALEIGRHVARLVEVLEADEAMTEAFLAGDGALTVTCTGVTFTGFEDRPDPLFVPSPMNDDAVNALYFAEVKTKLAQFFATMEHNPKSAEQWLTGDYELVVAPNIAEVRRRDGDDGTPMPGQYL